MLLLAPSCLVLYIARANPPGFGIIDSPATMAGLSEDTCKLPEKPKSDEHSCWHEGIRRNGCAPGYNETIPKPVYNRLQNYIRSTKSTNGTTRAEGDDIEIKLPFT